MASDVYLQSCATGKTITKGKLEFMRADGRRGATVDGWNLAPNETA
ncbi:type VI protein secretion system component Hcp [Massilia sp. MP_M2]